MLGTIDIMLVTENAITKISATSPLRRCNVVNVPDGHVRAGDDWETDGSGETLVTLGIIVLEADLEFDSLEEVALLCLKGILQELCNVGTHSGCSKTSACAAKEAPR